MGDAPDPAGSGGLQFDRAEGSAEASPSTCALCGKLLKDSYYEVSGKPTCERCKAEAQWNEMHEAGAGRFLRALAFGTLAAALGSALYYGVSALTGYEFGLIAIVVGVMVGAAVRKGARGRGGWLYQALAMFLTYASIVSTYIPQVWRTLDQREATPAAQSAEVAAGTAAMGLGAGMLFLFAFAMALPFLGGLQNIMGLVIIGIGLYEAWKLNRRAPLTVSGPYRVGQKPRV